MNRLSRLVKNYGVLVAVPIAVALLTASSAKADLAEPASSGIDDPAGLFYKFIITRAPFWVLGNPQPAFVTVNTALVAGAAGAAENLETLSLETAVGVFGTTYAIGDTFGNEAAGIIGADISVPTAWWTAPAVYTWVGGPAGGGGVAFFNSILNGVFYANELMVLDPASCSVTVCLQDFATSLGEVGTLPGANTLTVDPTTGDVSVPNPTSTEVPEPSSVILLLTMLVAVAYFTRSRVAQSAQSEG
jgi:hypothetical protein